MATGVTQAREAESQNEGVHGVRFGVCSESMDNAVGLRVRNPRINKFLSADVGETMD